MFAIRLHYKELARQYKIIGENRNDLFHGNYDVKTTVKQIMDAFEALNWINLNMWPK